VNRLSLEHSGAKVTVETENSCECLQDVVDMLIVPSLLAAGFADKTIGDCIASDVISSRLVIEE